MSQKTSWNVLKLLEKRLEEKCLKNRLEISWKVLKNVLTVKLDARAPADMDTRAPLEFTPRPLGPPVNIVVRAPGGYARGLMKLELGPH